MASWLQKETEKAIFNKIDYLIAQTGISNICLSGGVAYNCSAIGKILEITSAKAIYVHPAAGDHGQCVGNAILGHIQLEGSFKRKSFFNPYLGGEYKADLQEIVSTLGEKGYETHICEDIVNSVADLLAKGEFVAWFQGRSEYGPRALGNRSILANPSKELSREKLNVIKRRESYMPFAPSILSEETGNYFYSEQAYPYMTAALRAKESNVSSIPSVVHRDGSSRIQTVDKTINPLYHRLIKRFSEITGIPLLLNTSFNGPGEAIVETVTDALDCFKRIDIKYLAIGEILITKKDDESPIRLNTNSALEILIDNDLNIMEILQKHFPFLTLFPRKRFQLFDEYVEWVRSGRKVTTIRYKSGGIDYPERKMFELFATKSFKPDSPEEHISKIVVSKVIFKRFGDLSLKDAINDGFKSLEELINILTEIYGNIQDDEVVSVYSISLV